MQGARRAGKPRQVLLRETICAALLRWTSWRDRKLSVAKCDAAECVLDAGWDGGGAAGVFAEIDVEQLDAVHEHQEILVARYSGQVTE